MKRDNKSLIQLCADVIKKNQLFSSMITTRDNKIEQLEKENARLKASIAVKIRDYDTLYDRLLDKGEQMKEINKSMLNMAYMCNQKVDIQC